MRYLKIVTHFSEKAGTEAERDEFREFIPDAEKCPEKGWMLAYTRCGIVFEAYEALEQVTDRLKEQIVLELHLFNRDREYRVLPSRSKRFDGCLETVADFKNCPDEVFGQRVMLEEKYGSGGKLCVLNHVSYDAVGMAYVDNYRMYVEEGEYV